MYQSSSRLAVDLLVDDETDHSSYRTIGHREGTRQFGVDQSIRLGNMMQGFG